MNGDFELFFFFFSLSLFLISFSTESGFPSTLKQTNRTYFHQSFLGNFERVVVEGQKWIIQESDLRSLVAEQRINERARAEQTKDKSHRSCWMEGKSQELRGCRNCLSIPLEAEGALGKLEGSASLCWLSWAKMGLGPGGHSKLEPP